MNVKKHRGIYILIGIYLLLAAIFTIVNYDQLITAADTLSYTSCAENMIKSQQFLDHRMEFDTFRTPGYPAFLAAIFLLGGTLDVVVAVQFIISALCLFLIYKICIDFGLSTKKALLAAGLYACDLGVYIYTATVISDAFFMNMLVIAAYFLARYMLNKDFKTFVLFVVMMNVALLVRPILMYFNALIVLFLLVGMFIKKLNINIKHVVVAALVFSVVFCGWSARNYYHTGVFSYSDVRNLNLLRFDAATLKSNLEDIPMETAVFELTKELKTTYSDVDFNSITSSEYHVLEAQIGKKYINAHFPEYLVQNVEGLIKTMFGPNNAFLTATIENPVLKNVVAIIYVSYLAAIYLAYALGWLFNIKRTNILDWFILMASGYCAAASASLGYARFRVAFLPLIILGTVLIWKKIKSKKVAEC